MKPDQKPTAWPDFKRPLVAILRGIQPHETIEIIGALIEAGFEAIEIPLNSPDPFNSIGQAAKLAPEHVWIGAGTVLSTDDVDRLADAGGRLMVSPNVNASVIERACEHRMLTMPGVFTATEALAALAAGASALKFFPANILGPQGIKAICAVLPANTIVGAVGGVSESDFPAYKAAGISAFGLGSSLYKPGDSASAVHTKAETVIAQYDAVYGG